MGTINIKKVELELVELLLIKPIGAMLRSYSQPALPARGLLIRMRQWLDGASTLNKYFIIFVRQT
jgi:hypothetical protein